MTEQVFFRDLSTQEKFEVVGQAIMNAASIYGANRANSAGGQISNIERNQSRADINLTCNTAQTPVPDIKICSINPPSKYSINIADRNTTSDTSNRASNSSESRASNSSESRSPLIGINNVASSFVRHNTPTNNNTIKPNASFIRRANDAVQSYNPIVVVEEKDLISFYQDDCECDNANLNK